MSHPIVDIQNLHLSLVGGAGRVNILRGVNLQVETGDTLSIVGPSGAGKTSLLMVLSGLEKADSGLVQIAGTDMQQLDEDGLARFRRQQIGIVFQSFHLVPTMTALENVALPLEFAGVDDALDQAATALAATGLKARQDHFPGQLSGGEQQRVALARAFVARPKLILADEPTGNLDQETGAMVMELLFGLQHKFATTLILVTHDARLAARCQRTVRMADGLIYEATEARA
ncbi:putative ABC transport system ATP-binding protein [Desulfuromusa kysingii]|uniref:Putative ABC transport system ATP-binding protein n=1 Tax=Desulfuromusa kysingii TaxID=37625 RepID=A0A1H3X5D0_9BACT|nr:ATP-binding cassette domain-containing protein [Desulfuromusa kysingii]SDZ94463.1 putative ABC transport system ATP-binding protein [Desulfuromusa kysingii]